MHIMYVDESGDPGNSPLSSPHYILTGLIIQQDVWSAALESLTALRYRIQQAYGLKSSTEFHTAEIFRTSSAEYKSIKRSERINMLRDYVNDIPTIFPNAKVLNICIHKSDHCGVLNFQELAWSRMLHHFDTYLQKELKDKGMIISDESNEQHLRNQLRMGRNGTEDRIQNIIEDISHRKSNLSYFIQTCDVIAHCLYLREYPKGSFKKHRLEKMFDMLEPILLKDPGQSDPMGIVRT